MALKEVCINALRKTPDELSLAKQERKFRKLLRNRIKKFVVSEEGSLRNMVWMLGTAVVGVLIIVVFMKLAPQTAQDLWNAFIQYVHGSFGF